MNNVVTKSPWVIGNLSFPRGKKVLISMVAYEHSIGLPARFCAGMIPAADLSRRLMKNGFEPTIRVIDPTPIANHCNGWQSNQSQFHSITTEFFQSNGVDFFFDEAEQIDAGALEILEAIGTELVSCNDDKVIDMINRITGSGRRHGGQEGADNATLYMAAHPFSWLDMHHPSVWKRVYSAEDFHFVNLMSIPEERFKVIRDYLCGKRPDLCTRHNPVDRYTSVCHTPCYIPVEGEPTFADLIRNGPDWCKERYAELSAISVALQRAGEDFDKLMSFFDLSRFRNTPLGVA